MKNLNNLTDKELLRRTKLAEHNKTQVKGRWEVYLKYINKEINKYNEEYYRRSWNDNKRRNRMGV